MPKHKQQEKHQTRQVQADEMKQQQKQYKLKRNKTTNLVWSSSKMMNERLTKKCNRYFKRIEEGEEDKKKNADRMYKRATIAYEDCNNRTTKEEI